MNYEEIRRLLGDCSNALDISANMIGAENEIMKYIDGLRNNLNGTECHNAQGEDGKDAFEDICEQINKLQNNWNELKKWLEKQAKEYQKSRYSSDYGYALGFIFITQKVMQELEQGKDESKRDV